MARLQEVAIGFGGMDVFPLRLTIMPVLYREGQAEGKEEEKGVNMYPKIQQGSQFVAKYCQIQTNATVLQKLLIRLAIPPTRRPHFLAPGAN